MLSTVRWKHCFRAVSYTHLSAGVSSTLAEQMENYTKQGTDLASGVTDVMSDYLSVTAADMVSVSESDRDMTASGQEDETQTEEEKQAQALAEAASAFGYTNPVSYTHLDVYKRQE